MQRRKRSEGISDNEWHWVSALDASDRLKATTLGFGVPAQTYLAGDSDVSVLLRLSAQPRLDPLVVEALAANKAPQARAAVAKRKDVETSVLESLAGDDHWGVRHQVARNGSTPISTLERLLHDESERVQGAAALNASLTWTAALPAKVCFAYQEAVFWELVEGCDEEVAKGLVENWTGSIQDLVEAAGLVAR